MSALAFWKAVVQDRSGFLERAIAILEENQVRYCVIGGAAVNAYAEEAMPTMDLDIVVAVEDLARARQLFADQFRTDEFPNSFNVYDRGSKLQVQLQLNEGLDPIVERSQRRDVLDLLVPVADIADLFDLKVAAAMEPTRRRSKQGKDILDLGRLVSVLPDLRERIPPSLLTDVERFIDRPETD